MCLGSEMADIDEVKEELITLRMFFTVTLAIMIAIGSGLVSSYRDDTIDIVFWIGFLSEIVLSFMVTVIIKKIKLRTKRIKEL
jgi:uncharacterized membrane protein YvlD (DUF360 family)